MSGNKLDPGLAKKAREEAERKQHEKEVPTLLKIARGRIAFPDTNPPKTGEYRVISHSWITQWHQ